VKIAAKRKGERLSAELGIALPGLNLSGARKRALSVLLFVATFLLLSWLALIQKPYHDVFDEPSGIESLLYPVERNAFKRLPTIAPGLNDLHVLPDGEHLWAVGDRGLLLHSRTAATAGCPRPFPAGQRFQKTQETAASRGGSRSCRS